MQWYATHLPDERRFGTRIVHGDYKIDNLIFHRTEPRVIGILDWELSTLGHPVRVAVFNIFSGISDFLFLRDHRLPCVAL